MEQDPESRNPDTTERRQARGQERPAGTENREISRKPSLETGEAADDDWSEEAYENLVGFFCLLLKVDRRLRRQDEDKAKEDEPPDQ